MIDEIKEINQYDSDGQRHGYWKSCFYGGEEFSVGMAYKSYKHGIFHGVDKWFYSNGNILAVENFDAGFREGELIDCEYEN